MSSGRLFHKVGAATLKAHDLLLYQLNRSDAVWHEDGNNGNPVEILQVWNMEVLEANVVGFPLVRKPMYTRLP